MKSIQIQPELLQKPEAARRPKFPKKLLDEEGAFIDPAKEAALILPEQSVASAQINLEIAAAPTQARIEENEGLLSYVRSLIVSWVAWARNAIFGRRRRGRRLTKKGEQALEQLCYLSLLCDATTHRGPEEFLFAESVFGEAYHDILALSAEIEKTSAKEEEHHVRKYSKNMRKVLQTED